MWTINIDININNIEKESHRRDPILNVGRKRDIESHCGGMPIAPGPHRMSFVIFNYLSWQFWPFITYLITTSIRVTSVRCFYNRTVRWLCQLPLWFTGLTDFKFWDTKDNLKIRTHKYVCVYILDLKQSDE